MGTPPEVVIFDGDGNAVPQRPPHRPARTWGIAALAAALFFVLGVVVGARHGLIGGAAMGADAAPTSASESAPTAVSTAPIRPGKTVGALPGPVGPPPMQALIEHVEPPTPGSTGWELVGYGDYGDDGVLVRLRDGGGQRTTTRILAALRGATLTLPEAVPTVSTVTVGPDGAGGALARGWSGNYDVTPDGIRFVTSGVVLAVGPTGYLTWTCDDAGSCAAVYRDRDGGSERTIPAAGWNPGTVDHGIISPDGRYAALYRLDQRGTVLTILDLADGTAQSVAFTAATGDPGAQTMAVTPDSRYVMVVAGSGVIPVDLRRAEPLPPLSVPPLDPSSSARRNSRG